MVLHVAVPVPCVSLSLSASLRHHAVCVVQLTATARAIHCMYCSLLAAPGLHQVHDTAAAVQALHARDFVKIADTSLNLASTSVIPIHLDNKKRRNPAVIVLTCFSRCRSDATS